MGLHKLWLLFDPRRALVGLTVFLFALAIIIHFILLGTERYNWFAVREHSAASIMQIEPVPGPNLL